MEKDKEIEDILWINSVLSARSSRPESWMCRAILLGRYDLEVGSTVLLSWERKRSVYSLRLLSTGGIDVLFFQYLFQLHAKRTRFRLSYRARLYLCRTEHNITFIWSQVTN